MRSFKEPLVGTLLCGGLTWVLWSMATDAQAGVHREYHGRRAAMRALLGWLAEALGPAGSLALGGVVTAGMLGWLVYTLIQRKKAEKSPPPPAV